MAGPIVINVYNKDGGYFVVFKKERKENTDESCVFHGAKSPYIFMDLKSTKINIEPKLKRSNQFFRVAVSKSL